MRVEHEYTRGGALAYLAALDVHRAKVFGRCEATTGIVPFDRLVAQVMTQAPYATARRVFWIADNGSSHRGAASIERLRTAFPNVTLVHGPVHASWLNQIEIYFSIVQRKVLTPNDFESLAEVEDRLLAFQQYTKPSPHPFSGDSPETTSTGCFIASMRRRPCGPRRRRIRCRTYEPEVLRGNSSDPENQVLTGWTESGCRPKLEWRQAGYAFGRLPTSTSPPLRLLSHGRPAGRRVGVFSPVADHGGTQIVGELRPAPEHYDSRAACAGLGFTLDVEQIPG